MNSLDILMCDNDNTTFSEPWRNLKIEETQLRILMQSSAGCQIASSNATSI